MAGPGRPLALPDPANALRRQVIADRFDVLEDPLGWQCRFCDAVVQPVVTTDAGPDQDAVNRLAESAADHGLYCGRCDD